jgi:hypothetical protein
MSRTERFFQVVWRVNAVVVLVAAAGISFAVISFLVSELGGGSARHRAVEAAPQVGASQTGERLFVGRLSFVPGTAVLRGELQAHHAASGFISGSGYQEVRNLLFVKAGASTGHWLLPDSEHVVAEYHDVAVEDEGRAPHAPVATVVLAKPAHQNLDASEGELLVLDPAAERIQTVATGVRQLHVAAVRDNRLLLLFERGGRYVMVVLDVPSLAKRSEREIDVPQLK